MYKREVKVVMLRQFKVVAMCISAVSRATLLMRSCLAALETGFALRADVKLAREPSFHPSASIATNLFGMLTCNRTP